MDLPFFKQLPSDNVSLCDGLNVDVCRDFVQRSQITLPVTHLELLKLSNGLAALDGFVRLFGIGPGENMDLEKWNENDHWKFAWNQKAAHYLCFGETAWGDQYAYLFDGGRTLSSKVYVLGAFLMDVAVVAESFSEFMESVFFRESGGSSDPMTNLARKRFGKLDPYTNLVYVPSLLLGGQEIVENIVPIDARASMIVNGDIWAQLDEADENSVLHRMEDYTDAKGRSRLRLLWDKI